MNNFLDDENDAFLAGFDVLKIPIIRDGNPVWPEQFSLQKIDDIKRKTGLNKFSSQMMLEPVSINFGSFNLDDLIVYNDDLDITESNSVVNYYISGKRLKYYSCYWDPSFAGAKSDGSVIAVVFIDEDFHYYIHDVKYLNFDTELYNNYNQERNKSAKEQCKDVIDFMLRYNLFVLNVETNGIGKFLPELLRDEITSRRLNISVNEKVNKISKDIRIIDAIKCPLTSGFVHIKKNLLNTQLGAEFEEWNPIACKNNQVRDDGLDAVAGAILSDAVLISRFKINPLKHKGFRIYKVKNDFNV